eukprot:gene6622-6748_t
MRALVDLLRHGAADGRVLCFVREVALAYPLAHLLGAELQCRVLPVSGRNSMCDDIRERNIAASREGRARVLVSTEATEEGIDVPECKHVIRFQEFHTTKSH